jgi:uncharacterized OsmC-like protein
MTDIVAKSVSSSDVRQYAAEARSTDTFGRVLCNARNHHFVVDGPAQNGCPGEAITPPEAFLTGVAACGIELLQVIARELGLPIPVARVRIEGTVDRGHPVRSDVTVFNSVRLQFSISGVNRDQATDLVERFKKR